MSQYLVSEEQVKKALQIDSFRNLSKDKIVEFASLIPHMDKDVAIAIINQFPAYVESSRNMIEQYNAMCDKVLQSNDDSRKDAVMAYKTILDDLSILLKQDDITPEQQEKITDTMPVSRRLNRWVSYHPPKNEKGRTDFLQVCTSFAICCHAAAILFLRVR